MKIFQLIFLISILSLMGCSSKKAKTGPDAEVVAENSSEDSDFIVDADDEELIAEEEPLMESESEDITEVASTDSPESEVSTDIGHYTVRRGDTLMLVAFHLYGDYRKWKDIKEFNGLGDSMLSSDQVLKYHKPVQEFIWNPEGLPYLIKGGDTLATISNDKYGTDKKWKIIFDNNKPLIRDPNIIFAGFTLYYIPEREIASED